VDADSDVVSGVISHVLTLRADLVRPRLPQPPRPAEEGDEGDEGEEVEEEEEEEGAPPTEGEAAYGRHPTSVGRAARSRRERELR
jgi:hypothetical protein